MTRATQASNRSLEKFFFMTKQGKEVYTYNKLSVSNHLFYL